jgi:hypothetical protein
MPQIFEDLFTKFEGYCKAFNDKRNPRRKLYCHKRTSQIFTVTPDALVDIVTVTMSTTPHKIRVVTSAKTEDNFSPYVVMNGEGEVHLTSIGGQVIELSKIVASALESAIPTVEKFLDSP